MDFAEFKAVYSSGENEYLFYRIDSRKEGYYIAIKKERLDRLKKVAKDTLGKDTCLFKGSPGNRGVFESEVVTHFFKNGSPAEIKDDFQKFHIEFVKELERIEPELPRYNEETSSP